MSTPYDASWPFVNTRVDHIAWASADPVQWRLPSQFAVQRRDGGVLSCDPVPDTRSPAAAAGGAPTGRSGAAQLGKYRRAGRVGSCVHQNPNELGAEMQA
jgi:hypothetical protein